jgi:glycosyltransferase involved in cell wall biosynthesis
MNTLPKLLVFAPTRSAASETFIRANLGGLPFQTYAYFGDERSLSNPLQLLYGVSILVSKGLTRIGWFRFSSLPGSLVALLLVKYHKPNLILAEFGFHAIRVMNVASWSGVPLVVHFRGSDASSESKFLRLKKKYRILMRLASAFIVKSIPMANTLKELGAPAEWILISPSGANSRYFYGSSPATSPPLLLAVGRFVAKKGPLFTLAAFKELLQKLPKYLSSQCHLVMVGDGPLMLDAKKMVAKSKIAHQVLFAGVLQPSEVAALMREARMFVQHSKVAPDGDSEGSPVAIMEAQLSGLPVVATFHAGIPEVVLQGVTGFLVDEGDVNGMATAMAKLVLDPGMASEMGAKGQSRVIDNFTLDHHFSAVSALLNRVIREFNK